MTTSFIKCKKCQTENRTNILGQPANIFCSNCKTLLNDLPVNMTSNVNQPKVDQSSIQRSLDKIRPKLLDLTKRNRLLNFKETTHSLAIIDELPTLVFNRIVNDQAEMFFQPLPEQEQKEDMHKASPDREITSLKKQSRKEISNNKSKPLINVDLDLPETPKSSKDLEPKYLDDRLQTTHDSDRLEAKLRKISSTAKTIIEETGTNQLYLAMGFLEWRESHTSEEVYSAPLILIPIELNKCEKLDTRTKTFRYGIKYTDEDLMTNITLAEKLKREFNVILPEFDETTDPEQYFKDVAEAISYHKHWIVRRRIVVGFFTFAKLLMYLDLDPNKWPNKRNILDHPQINGVLNGHTLGDADLLQESKVEENSIANSLPLVLDADSSQHASIADIIQGKSLVIEGPPGTGKSQTITNIIATALAAGKKVLFAAEKLAALEVVRRNLNKVGLGDFCLELHSHKAQKRKLLDELKIRLRRSYRTIDDLDHELNQLNRLRQHLHAYVDLIKTPVGPKRETIYQILWKAEHYRTLFKTGPKFLINNVNSFSDHDVQDTLSTLEELANFVKDGILTIRQTWHGFSLWKLRYGEESKLNNNISTVQDKINNIIIESQKLIKEAGMSINSESLLMSDIENLINIPTKDLPKTILPSFFKNIINNQIKEIKSSLDYYAQVKDDYDAALKLATKYLKIATSIDPQEVNDLLVIIASLKDLGLLNLSLLEIKNLISIFSDINNDIQTVFAYAQKLKEFGINSPQTILDLKNIFIIFDSIRNRPEIKYPESIANFFNDSSIKAFEDLRKESESIVSQLKKLTTIFSIPDLPTREEIAKIRKIFRLKLGKTFSFLSSDFRKNKKLALTFLKSPEILKDKEVINKLEELDDYLQAQSAFEKNDNRLIFGSYYKGHETDWDEVKRLIVWLKDIYSATNSESAVIAIVNLPKDKASHVSSDPALKDLSNRILINLERIANLRVNHFKLNKIFGDNLIDDFLAILSEIRHKIQNGIQQLSNLVLEEVTNLNIISEALQSLKKCQEIKNNLKSSQLSILFGADFSGIETNLDSAQQTIKIAEILKQRHLPQAFIESIIENNYTNIINSLETFQTICTPLLDDVKKLLQELNQFGSLDEGLFLGKPLAETSITFLYGKISQLVSSSHNSLNWADYCRATLKARDAGLNTIIDLIEAGELSTDNIQDQYLYSFYYSLAQFLIKKEELLYDFTRAKHEEKRRRFSKLDKEILKLNCQRIASLASEHKPPYGISTGPIKTWTELALVKHEITKSRQHIPIRQLIKRAGVTLQTIKPCFMMSPMSVAQYLEPGILDFDLLIMDESSQVRPHEALGVIARASQIVIVGDSKQLPPTTFFDNIGEESLEDDANLIDESDSILDVCVAANMPLRSLRWHYRSEHESLIAFSNSQYYNNDLIIFPSPDGSKNETGLVYRYIDGATYASSKNLKEAQAVAKAIAEHARLHPHLSLGVGTFNIQQRDLIEDCLEALIKDDPSLELAITKLNKVHDGNEPFFIKNLENIQGDERDVIFISCTYGREPESGKVMNRFGPINGKFGWRRLNVMFSRAKKRMVIFTSMQPEDINAGPNVSEGANSLKKILEYARSGKLPDFGQTTGRLPDSDFEVAVSKVLQHHGYSVTPQIGVAGYFVDLGVNHPNRPGEYLLGIECDGATYHSSRSARDRDRLKEEVLIKRGWNLYRIWSTDWFKNREPEIERLLKHLKWLSHINHEISPSNN